MHQSFWKKESFGKRYPEMSRDHRADVAVVGGGIAGVTAALLLARAGKRVVLLEKDRIGSGETGKTTAHLTEAMDTGYRRIERDFGREGSRLVAAGSRHAIETIATLSREYEISCHYESIPGYFYSEYAEENGVLREEYEAAKRAGLQVELVDQVPLPFKTVGGVRFENQAQFHPGEYLAGLTEAFVEAGGVVFENSPMLALKEDDPLEIQTPGGYLRADQAFVAAHVPVNNRFALFTKIASYRSYAMAVQSPSAERLHGLFWDTMDPYHYIRRASQNGEAYLIVGGEDHKTGTRRHTDRAYKHLEGYARERLEVESVEASWSGQIVESVDGLPYIGRNPFSEKVFVATGFSGQGITFGTLSARVVSDLVLGRSTGWTELFSPARIKPMASATHFLSENADVAVHLLKDRIAQFTAPDMATVARGEGKIVRVGSRPLAVYRDEEDELHGFSPACPHLGCHVAWNSGEKTWDCPCHGSRFDSKGGVLNGPAKCGLTKVDVEQTLAEEHRHQGNNVPILPKKTPLEKRTSKSA